MKQLIRFVIYGFMAFGFIGIMPVSANSFIITSCDFTGEGSISEAVNTLNELPTGGSIIYEMPCETIFESRLIIRKNMNISANNPNVFFNGNNATALIMVDYGALLTLDRINLINGFSETAGGAIENYGTLVIRNGYLGNHIAVNGGAIYSVGVVTITTTSLIENVAQGAGGGIFSSGTLTITHSNISQNTAVNGGGVYSNGTFALEKTILTQNTATSAGAGIYNSGVHINGNNTFANNTATNFGGGIFNESSLVLTHNTFTTNESANGGAVFDTGMMLMTASIFHMSSCVSINLFFDGGRNIAYESDGCPGDTIDPQLENLNRQNQIFYPQNHTIEYPPPCLLPSDAGSFTRPQGTLCTPGSHDIQDN